MTLSLFDIVRRSVPSIMRALAIISISNYGMFHSILLYGGRGLGGARARKMLCQLMVVTGRAAPSQYRARKVR
jgi:hypothetical protein